MVSTPDLDLVDFPTHFRFRENVVVVSQNGTIVGSNWTEAASVYAQSAASLSAKAVFSDVFVATTGYDEVWTGTTDTGTYTDSCGGWTTTTGTGRVIHAYGDPPNDLNCVEERTIVCGCLTNDFQPDISNAVSIAFGNQTAPGVLDQLLPTCAGCPLFAYFNASHNVDTFPQIYGFSASSPVLHNGLVAAPRYDELFFDYQIQSLAPAVWIGGPGQTCDQWTNLTSTGTSGNFAFSGTLTNESCSISYQYRAVCLCVD
jgi:hypothetical protein